MLSTTQQHANTACSTSTTMLQWTFVNAPEACEGFLGIATMRADERDGVPTVEALYECATGNVYACHMCGSSRTERETSPCVRMIGGVDGDTGQVLVRQSDGAYRRMARWDRLAPDVAARSGAALRTLPQCGCGGSLGAPKLFDSFEDMAAYHYCNFARSGEL